MSRLTDLLHAAKQLDAQLGKDLEDEIRPLQKRLPFGLNFERHAPEAVELAGHKIRKGSKVRVLPPRGSTSEGDRRFWRVDAIRGDVAEISLLDRSEDETISTRIDDLILVAEFRDWIYPGLRPDGTVERGGDKPFHTVINGENFHVLEQLTFTHAGSIDAIYIDPPYNTGARDWKYNNHYVEGDDLYRHSKWLAFMERRLKLAKRLLKPEQSVLIVTIDEKEYLRLGMLLEQIFAEADIQMVSTVISPQGSSRPGGFARVDEYIYFVRLGSSRVITTGDDMLVEAEAVAIAPVWFSMIRSGTGARREDSKNLFYPIFVQTETREVVRVGTPLPLGISRDSVLGEEGCETVWPIRRDGSEGRWQLAAETFRQSLAEGFAKIGDRNNTGGRSVMYVRSGDRTRIQRGDILETGKDQWGYPTYSRTEDGATRRAPKSVWNKLSHDAGKQGSMLISRMLDGRKFPFPKSLYAVEDALRFYVANNPDAIVLDFFAGSGTTAHAVMRLNKQDSGRRISISVTNNEVGAGEQIKLRRDGLRPGDPEWEQWGICDHITKPRITAAISGSTPSGDPIKGDYKFLDEFPMADGFEENAAFFTLTYESPWRVSTDRAFAAIAPMLWLRAGARGRRIESISNGWAVAEAYGVIKDLDLSADFIAALQSEEDVRVAFIVTDDEGRYQQVANEIPGIQTVRLYEDYLRNCESNGDF